MLLAVWSIFACDRGQSTVLNGQVASSVRQSLSFRASFIQNCVLQYFIAICIGTSFKFLPRQIQAACCVVYRALATDAPFDGHRSSTAIISGLMSRLLDPFQAHVTRIVHTRLLGPEMGSFNGQGLHAGYRLSQTVCRTGLSSSTLLLPFDIRHRG